jgi:uncharacterized membrane protein YgcG
VSGRGGGGLRGLVGFAGTLAFYEAVGLGLYLGFAHPGTLTALADSEDLAGLATGAAGAVLARPDALAVAVALGLLAGVVTFVQTSTPGVPDLFGPDAPTGLAYPFTVLQVAVGIVVGTVLGTVIGAGLYLAAVRPDAIGGVGTPGLGAAARYVLGLVVANPDALVGALCGGAIGFWSGYTGRIWVRSDPHDRADSGHDGGGGFGGFGGFGGGGGGGGGGGSDGQ